MFGLGDSGQAILNCSGKRMERASSRLTKPLRDRGLFGRAPFVLLRAGIIRLIPPMFRICECILGSGLALVMFAPLAIANSKSQETVLYSFQGGGAGDGEDPAAGLTQDKKGNFYGTTYLGGGTGCGGTGCGTVFKLAPDGTVRVLYSFDGTAAAYPSAGLIMDTVGNLYGTTSEGGCDDCGTVFKIAPDGTETVLHSFQGGSDGAYPVAGLIIDKKGNLFGTTAEGGADGAGTVFKITPKGKEAVFYSFDYTSGQAPRAGLIMDKKGNLYGTTNLGGVNSWGTVFELAPEGTETVLHSFIPRRKRWRLSRRRADHGHGGQSLRHNI